MTISVTSQGSVWKFVIVSMTLIHHLSAQPKQNLRDVRLLAQTDRVKDYSSWRYELGVGYNDNEICKIRIKALYRKDNVRVEVKHSDIEPHVGGQCTDVVTVHDGYTDEDPVLGQWCGQETPNFESSGQSMLLVFKTDGFSDRVYQGFTMKYWSIDRGGYEDEYGSDSSGSSTALIVTAAVIPGILIYIALFAIAYRRCKQSQGVRRNEATAGHTTDDLQMAMASMLDQANSHNGRGTATANTLDQTIQSPLRRADDPSSGAFRENLVVVMDGGRGTSPGERRGRVRHPAGNAGHSHALSPQQGLTSCPPNQRHPWEDTSRSSDGTPRGTGYLHGGGEGYPFGGRVPEELGLERLFPGDSSRSQFQSGDLHEPDILFPQSQSYHGVPSAPAPSAASSLHGPSYLGHHPIEEDQRSHGSGRRSPYTSGRNSPRDGRSAGRASPYHHWGSNAEVRGSSPRSRPFLDPENTTYTYYGMVDSAGGEGVEADLDLSMPPPSYEEAATGKYSPKPPPPPPH